MSYKRVRDLDPLQLDSSIGDLPKINTERDTITLRRMANYCIDGLDPTTFTPDEATAALRDLDFVLSSGIRHGIDMVQENPDMEQTLIALGQKACNVPRGTVMTYALHNPTDERQRMFVGSLQERLFIDRVRSGAESVERALAAYVNDDPVTGLGIMSSSVQDMVTSVVDVKRGITPAYFTNELRPYFDPITVDGVSYAGSGGAQLQFVAIDYLLWGG